MSLYLLMSREGGFYLSNNLEYFNSQITFLLQMATIFVQTILARKVTLHFKNATQCPISWLHSIRCPKTGSV